MHSNPNVISVDPAKADQMPTRTAIEAAASPDRDRLAIATIKRYVPEGPERQWVIDALFAEADEALPAHGANVTEERTAWLKRCRAYFADLGRPLSGTHVPMDMQRQYEDASGDMRPTARAKGRVK